ILAGITQDPETMPTYDHAFLNTAQSFHAMTENEQDLARPLHLRTIQADSHTDFNSLAQQSPLEHYPIEQLRLINGLYPKGQLTEGMLLKIIEEGLYPIRRPKLGELLNSNSNLKDLSSCPGY
ncbi:MAG: hypothetical protein V3V89_06075, partial [Gammaproteobacteria bacterium]